MSHLAPLKQRLLEHELLTPFLVLIGMMISLLSVELEVEMVVDSDGQPRFFSQALYGDR